jgi:hypothetical protein
VSYRGRVKDGLIVLDAPATLPEGAVVEVVVVSEGSPRPVTIPTLAERYASVVGIVVGLPPDLASDHDRDLHGTARPADE